MFDPNDLSENITPESARAAAATGNALKALLISLRLNDDALLQHALMSAQPTQVGAITEEGMSLLALWSTA